jgi:outer membrane protein TolC
VQQQICDILFQVRNAYYTVLLNQAHLAIDQFIIQLWEEEVRRQERFLQLGAAIPFELNQARLHLKSAWSDYYDSQSEIKTSQIKLLTILGLPPNTPLQLAETEIPLPPIQWQQCHLEQWMQWALQYRPQLKQEQLTYWLSQNKVCQTKAEKLPTVSFYANAGNRYVNNGFDAQPYVGTGINVNWKLYDPSNKPRLRQAEEVRKEAASNYYQAELETNAAIYALLNELDKSYLAFQNAKEGAALAEQGIQIAIKKHQLGMMSAFEYRDAIKTLHEAQQQVNHAKFDLHNAYDRLVQQTGLDLIQKN